MYAASSMLLDLEERTAADLHSMPQTDALGDLRGGVVGLSHTSEQTAATQLSSQSQQPLARSQSYTFDPTLPIISQIELVVANVLDALLEHRVPFIPFAPAVDAEEAAAVLKSANDGTRQTPKEVSPSGLSQHSRVDSETAKAAGTLGHGMQAKAGLTISATNQKVTDRFCRAMIVLDAIHVRHISRS